LQFSEWPFFSRHCAPLGFSSTINFLADEAPRLVAATYVVVERDQLPDADLERYLFGGANHWGIFIDR
jgi:hypothetical protein